MRPFATIAIKPLPLYTLITETTNILPRQTIGTPKPMPPSEYTGPERGGPDDDVPVNKLTSFNGRLNQYFHASKNVDGGRTQDLKTSVSTQGLTIPQTDGPGVDSESGSGSASGFESKRRPRSLEEQVLPTTTTSNPESDSKPKLKRRKDNNNNNNLLPPRTTRSKSTTTTPFSPSPTPTPQPPTRHRRNPPPASASPPASSSLLRDTIPAHLTLLLVGVNPGILTGKTGFVYAHPSNLYWKLLHSSGITTARHPPSDTYRLPELYNVGNTNIVERPTRDASMLSKAEMDAGVPVLEAKVAAQRPEAVCLVGKSIWEAVWRVRKGRGIRKEEFKYGWQGEEENMGRSEEWGGAPVFVATTTSGLAAGMTMAQKEAVWNELGRWVVGRREEKKVAEGQVYRI